MITAHVPDRNDRLWLTIAIVMSLAFGVVSILPNVWQRFDKTYPFQGIEMMGTDQEHYYAQRIGQVLRGDLLVGDPHGIGPSRYIQPPLAEWVEGGLGASLHLDAPRTVIAVKLILGALLALTMMLFFARFTGHRWWAVLAASALLFAGFLSTAPATIPSFFFQPHFDAGFLRFSRPTNPLFSSLLFFLALHAFLSWAQRRSIIALAITGVLTGLAFYAYPYTWSYLGFTYVVACTFFLFKRDWRHLRDMAILALVTGIVALPYFVHQMVISHDPVYPEMLYKFIVLHTRKPVVGVWMFAFLLLPFLPRIRTVFRPWWLLFALAFAGLLAMDQQLISGVMVMPQHYHWYYTHPLALMSWILFLGAVVIGPLFRHYFSDRWRSIFFSLALIALVGIGVRFQQFSYEQSRPNLGALQHAAPMLTYLNDHAQPSDVTFGWGPEKEMIPLYTPGNAYLSANSSLCLCSSDRSLTSYFITLWLSGVTSTQARHTFFTTSRFDVSSNYRGTYWREAGGTYESIPNSEVAYVLAAYRQFLALPDDQKLSKYRMDYFVIADDVIATLPEFSHITERADKVFDDRSYAVWKIRR